MPVVQVSTERTLTSVMPAASSASIAGSPRSWPRSTTTLPLASTASTASVRAYVEVSTCASRISVPSACFSRDRGHDAALGLAIVLAHDDVLRHVDQTTGQVTRVRGTKRGVGQTLTSTVRVDEVLQHGQALPEGRLDRARDELTLRVRHQALHAGQGARLVERTGGAGVDHLMIGLSTRVVRLAWRYRPLRWLPSRS